MKSEYCRESGILIGPTKSRTAHMGALFLGLWKTPKTTVFTKFLVLSLLSLWVLLNLSFLCFHFLELHYFDFLSMFSKSLSGINFFILLFGAIPICLFSSFCSRGSLLEKIWFVDFWVFSFLLFSCSSVIYSLSQHAITEPQELLALLETFTLNLVVIALGFILWLFIRIAEAQRLSSSCSPETDVELTTPSELKTYERIFMWLGFMYVLLSIGMNRLFGFEISGEHVLAGLCILSLPYHRWFVSQLYWRNFKNKIFVGSMKIFEKLRTTQHFRCHEMGVFYSDRLQLKRAWFDSSSAWTEEQIKTEVASMTSLSEHPASQCLSEEYKANKKTLRYSDIENHPHLGLSRFFRNEQGEGFNVFLGNPLWAFFEKHQWSSEATKQLSKIKNDSNTPCILSLNKRVVAIFEFSCQEKLQTPALKAKLSQEPISISVLSSRLKESLQLESPQLMQKSFEKLPLERELQNYYWNERLAESMEVAADWDSPDNESNKGRVLFYRNFLRKPFETEIMIQTEHALGLSNLFQESRSWHLMKRSFPIVAILGSLLVFAAPHPSQSLGLSALITLFISLFCTQKHSKQG